MKTTDKPLIDEHGDVREITSEDLKNFRPIREVMSPKFFEAMGELIRMRGRPKQPETKQAVSLRLSRDVIEHFKKGGAGWQTRIDQALRDMVEGLS